MITYIPADDRFCIVSLSPGMEVVWKIEGWTFNPETGTSTPIVLSRVKTLGPLLGWHDKPNHYLMVDTWEGIEYGHALDMPIPSEVRRRATAVFDRWSTHKDAQWQAELRAEEALSDLRKQLISDTR